MNCNLPAGWVSWWQLPYWWQECQCWDKTRRSRRTKRPCASVANPFGDLRTHRVPAKPQQEQRCKKRNSLHCYIKLKSGRSVHPPAPHNNLPQWKNVAFIVLDAAKLQTVAVMNQIYFAVCAIFLPDKHKSGRLRRAVCTLTAERPDAHIWACSLSYMRIKANYKIFFPPCAENFCGLIRQFSLSAWNYLLQSF